MRRTRPAGRVDMCATCKYVGHMSKMIQVRNVPDELHREVKVRAARAGMTLSDFLLVEIRRAMARPSRADLLARLAALPPVDVDPTATLRAERDER